MRRLTKVWNVIKSLAFCVYWHVLARMGRDAAIVAYSAHVHVVK